MISSEIPENVRRGKSAILWTKIFLALGVASALYSEYIIHVGKSFLEMSQGSAPVQPPDPTLLLTVLFFFFLTFCLSVVSLVIIYKFCKWLHNTTTFLRKYTSTKFSPFGAVICTMIPWICGFVDYFIFKDILDQQKRILAAKDEKFKPLDKKVLIAIPVLTALIIVPMPFVEDLSARIASLVAFVFITGAYIKTMETLVENEESLYAMRERILLNRKVEEILAQRENS